MALVIVVSREPVIYEAAIAQIEEDGCLNGADGKIVRIRELVKIVVGYRKVPDQRLDVDAVLGDVHLPDSAADRIPFNPLGDQHIDIFLAEVAREPRFDCC